MAAKEANGGTPQPANQGSSQQSDSNTLTVAMTDLQVLQYQQLSTLTEAVASLSETLKKPQAQPKPDPPKDQLKPRLPRQWPASWKL